MLRMLNLRISEMYLKVYAYLYIFLYFLRFIIIVKSIIFLYKHAVGMSF